MSVYDIEPGEYNKKLAEALKKVEEFQVPEWMAFVKSGTSKVRPSQQPDFWHIRAASILRQIYIHGIVGVGRLRTKYGGRKKRGTPPAEFRKASGKIIRVILQQADKAGFLEKFIGKRAGRKLTKKGVEFMENIGSTK